MTPKKKPQTSKQKNGIRAKRIARLVRLLTQDETKDGSSLWTPVIKIIPDNSTDLAAKIILRGVVAGWMENLTKCDSPDGHHYIIGGLCESCGQPDPNK